MFYRPIDICIMYKKKALKEVRIRQTEKEKEIGKERKTDRQTNRCRDRQ